MSNTLQVPGEYNSTAGQTQTEPAEHANGHTLVLTGLRTATHSEQNSCTADYLHRLV